jgi:hypothetical protein
MRLCGKVTTTAALAAVLVVAPSIGRGQSPSSPPTALPLHSALPGDQVAPSATSPGRYGRTELTAALPPPSNNATDFVPLPPLATPQPGGPTLPTEPPPAPWFSLAPSYIPPGAKSGAFQQSLLRATYLPRLGGNGFGMTDVTKQLTFALPPFIAGSPILLTPAATSHFLDGPNTPDLPSEVYDFELEFRYLKQVTPRLGIDLAAAPSYFGDLKNDSHQAWRVTGRALAAYDWTPTVKLVAGALVLGRADYPALPAGGVIWKPSDDWRLDFIFPKPKFARRMFVDGDVEHWSYLAGEFGGNTWAYDRPGGIADKFTYSDLRLIAGWQRYTPSGLSGRVEAGWVFHREITLESGLPGDTPPDTFMVRGEMSY